MLRSLFQEDQGNSKEVRVFWTSTAFALSKPASNDFGGALEGNPIPLTGAFQGKQQKKWFCRGVVIPVDYRIVVFRRASGLSNGFSSFASTEPKSFASTGPTDVWIYLGMILFRPSQDAYLKSTSEGDAGKNISFGSHWLCFDSAIRITMQRLGMVVAFALMCPFPRISPCDSAPLFFTVQKNSYAAFSRVLCSCPCDQPRRFSIASLRCGGDKSVGGMDGALAPEFARRDGAVTDLVPCGLAP